MNQSVDTLLQAVVKAADDKKAHNITVLDLKGISLIADYFVICHGNSDTQVQAIVSEIRKVADSFGVRVKGVEGADKARWVLVDLGDVVAHVFHRDEREYYNLERLWSDARIVETV
ncbi:ribosome silencing factor [Paenibacillus thermoaerophilus]|jgi:ribosome-associated protein|uniref:Ribosomal silencing factor RsfS n=1 Tax=Paenibacillus thermoaerophilus TaxID=1215385 RepID=A0ABW2UZ73_9BACL|nr:ribosome silencing factor [Paenibacillus thermoaerophilus]TMV18968.1 ribosome silencing factor [Paenibacillus thermoaerophilus]